MYTCSVTALVRPNTSLLASLRNILVGVWKEAAASPALHTTYVSVHNRLLAIGGKELNQTPTTAIHMYNPTTDSWEVISHMGTPRWDCIAAVLPNNQLMVIGGCCDMKHEVLTTSTEFATCTDL